MLPLIILSSTPDGGKKYILDDAGLSFRGPAGLMEPAFALFNANKKTWDATLIHNSEGVNYWKSTTLRANHLNNATTIDLTNVAGKPINIKPNMKIKNITTGDIYVTSATPGDIVVTAGTKTVCSNVTGVTAAGTAGDTIIILNPLHEENTDFGTDDSRTSTITKYATQIFMHAFDFSRRAMNIESMIANGDAKFEIQKQRVLKQCEDDVLTSIFQGAYAISTQNSESGFPAKSENGGIIDSFTRAGGTITNLAGALTLDILSNYAVEMVDKKVPLFGSDAYVGSNAEHVIFANYKTRKKLNFLDSSNVRRDQEIRMIKTGVTAIEVAGVNFDLIGVPQNCLPDGWIIMMHKNQYEFGALQNSEWSIQEVSVQHAGKKWGVYGEYGGVLKFPDTIKVVKGITV